MPVIKRDVIIKIHLIISVLIVVPVAFVYGFNPSIQFDIHLNTTDEHSFFKAIMGLYLGFSVVWLLGVFNHKYLKAALLSNTVFMLGLGTGRLLSILLDGAPTFGYLFGAYAELFLGCYGLWVLLNHHTTTQP